MPIKRWLLLVFSFLCVFLPIVGIGHAGVPEVSHIMVTDVTTVSFSVIWAASEASTGGLAVYADAEGMIPVTEAVIVPHPVNDPLKAETIALAAQSSGVMKVMVTGLQPDTTYYFRTITTSKNTSDITYAPSSSPFTAVTTEVQTTRTYKDDNGNILPFSNDVIIEPCYLSDGTTPANGSLLIATVAGGHHPITAFVGDGVESPYALIDLNNVFGRETFENLDLQQGKNLTLVNYRGTAGYSIVIHDVPADNSLAEIKTGEYHLKTGSNLISFPLDPSDNNPSIALAPILDKLDVVWGKDDSGKWVFFIPDFPFNSLTSISAVKAYWLTMLEDASLKVEGTFHTDSIPLKTGLNQVGFRSIETHDINDLIGNISDEIDVIWGKDDQNQWVFFIPNFPFNSLNEIIPGDVYSIYTTIDCDW